MQKLNDYIEEKKIKSNKAPRYGMKKLAVGLVSCILGYTVLVSPSVAYAEEVREPEAVVMEAEEEEKEEAVLPEETEEGEEKDLEEQEEAEEQAEKENALQVSEEEKEAVTAAETKEEEKTEEEVTEKTEEKVEETEKKLVTLDEYNALQEEENEEDGINIEDAELVSNVLGVTGDDTEGEIELSEEVDPEAQTAGEASEETKEGKDISNNIINPRVSIRTENTTTPETLDAGLGEQLTWGVSFTTPEGTKEGDTFTVKLSDNMSLKGLEPDTDYALPVKFGDKIIATAKRIDRQTIQYTFTKDIEEMKYARVYIINSAQENKDVVQNSGKQTFKINVGEKAKAEKDINVDFGKLYHAETSENVNGRSQFTEFNPETGEFTQVFYLNPESKEINTSSTNDQNGREWGKVGFLLSSPHDADKPRSVDYLKDNTKIEVKKLSKGAKLPDAVIENPEGAQLATNVEGGFRNFKGEPMFIMNFGGGNKIDSPYVVVVKGHANKIDGKYTELYSNGTLYGDGEASLFLDNLYTVQENSTDSEGEKETLGYFKEHHIYITKEDGTEKSRFEIPGATVSGTADQYYYTDKNEIPGYHFVKVDTDSLKFNPAYNENGEEKKGNFEVGKTKEVTYIYENDIKKGSFKETHVYITKDFDGNVVGEPITEPGKSSEGTKDKPYTSAKVDKAGYVLDKVTADEGSEEVKISDDKKSVIPGNYIEDKNLSVTYEYVKQPGRFVEHHIYKTVDKEGNVVSTDDEVDVREKDGRKFEGFSNEIVNTGKKDKTGYSFKEATEIKLQNDDSNKTYTNYVPGKVLEKTYIYTKTKEEEPVVQTGTFTEEHIYKTLDFEGKVVETSDPEQGEHKEGNKDVQYTTKAKEKEGFKLVSVEANDTDVVIDSENGTAKTGNIVEGKDLKVTYTYEKRPGRFVEHHIYKTVDKNGKEVSEDYTEDVTEKDDKKFEGYSNEKINTSQKSRDGYTYKSETILESENYVPGQTLEKTYIYVKEQEEPATPISNLDPKEDPKDDPTPDPTPTPEETPVEEPKEDPAPKHEEETPEPKEEPKTEEPKEEETPKETPVEEPKEEEKEVVIEKEEDDEADRSNDTTHKHEGKEDYSKAPQTGVAGAAGYLGLAGLGTALLAALEDKKKKKNK